MTDNNSTSNATTTVSSSSSSNANQSSAFLASGINFSSLLSSQSSQSGRYPFGIDQSINNDKNQMNTNRSFLIAQYYAAGAGAGLSKAQIQANIQNADAITNNTAKSSDLSQNTMTPQAVLSAYQSINAMDTSTPQARLLKAQASLNTLTQSMLSDKNAFKYDESQKGVSSNQSLLDLQSFETVQLASMSQLDQIYQSAYTQFNKPTNQMTANNGSQGTGTDAGGAGASTGGAAGTAGGSGDFMGYLANDNKKHARMKAGKDMALYADSVNVSKTKGKDGKYHYKFKLSAKTRADLDNSEYGGRYLNNSGTDGDHGQYISREALNKILKANGKKALTNKQIESALASGKPLFNANDNLAFNANVTKGKDSKHFNIDEKSIKKSDKPFSSKHERQAEQKKNAKAAKLRKAAKSAKARKSKTSHRARHATRHAHHGGRSR